MARKIDKMDPELGIDIGFVNYRWHPTNKDYVVFRFKEGEMAEAFEEKLKSSDIWYEKAEEERGYILFGIHKSDYKKAEKINYDVTANHKKPFIDNKLLRYFLMLLTIIMVGIGLIGFFLQE